MAGLEGAVVATVTPFKRDGSVDTGYIYDHLQLLQRGGIQGIVPVGTNGEFPSLTVAEKKQVLAAAAGAKADLFMIAGIGSCNMSEAVELADFAAGVGADALLAVPPFYYSDAPASGVAAYYLSLMDRCDLPVFLYNIPQYSGIAITDEVIGRLAGHARLAGIKDSQGDMVRTRQMVESFPNLKVFGGSDTQIGETLAAGAAGFISGVGNIFPEFLRDIWEASLIDVGVTEAAARVKEIRLIIKNYPWIAATKYCLSLRGLPESGVRLPLVDLDDSQKNDLSDMVGMEIRKCVATEADGINDQ